MEEKYLSKTNKKNIFCRKKIFVEDNKVNFPEFKQNKEVFKK